MASSSSQSITANGPGFPPPVPFADPSRAEPSAAAAAADAASSKQIQWKEFYCYWEANPPHLRSDASASNFSTLLSRLSIFWLTMSSLPYLQDWFAPLHPAYESRVSLRYCCVGVSMVAVLGELSMRQCIWGLCGIIWESFLCPLPSSSALQISPTCPISLVGPLVTCCVSSKFF